MRTSSKFRQTAVALSISLWLCVSLPAQTQVVSDWKSNVDAGIQACDEENYAAAFDKLEIARKQTESFGPDSLELATCLDALAYVYLSQKRFDQSELLYKRVIAIREKKLDADNYELAEPLSGMAELCCKQRRFTEAESFFVRALKIEMKKLGPDHPDVLQTQSNLAAVYEDEGRYAEAEPLFKRVLQLYEEHLAPTHLRVAAALNELARLYLKQDRYADAEPLAKRCVEIRETKLGPDHLKVAESVSFLASVVRAQGRYAEAEPLYKRALAIVEKSNGIDDPKSADYGYGLAQTYLLEGRYAEAESLYKSILDIYERKLGADDPNVALICNDLAEMHRRQGEFAEADVLFKRALAISEKKFGLDSMEVAAQLNNLAVLDWRQGKFDESELLFIRCIGILEKRSSTDQLLAATSMSGLAMLYSSMHAYDRAESLAKRALEITEKRVGENHPAVAGSLNILADIYRAQGRYNEAGPLFKRALDITEKVFGTDNPDVALHQSNLASIYEFQGRYAEAEPLYKSSFKTFAKTGTNLSEGRGFRQRALAMQEEVRLSDETTENVVGNKSPEVGFAKLQSALSLVSVGGIGKNLFQESFALLKPLAENLISVDSSMTLYEIQRQQLATTVKKLGGRERAVRKMSAVMLCLAYPLSEAGVEAQANSAAYLSLNLLKKAVGEGATTHDIELLLSLSDYFESESQYASCQEALSLAVVQSKKLQNPSLQIKSIVAAARVDMAEGDYIAAKDAAIQAVHEMESQGRTGNSSVEALDILAVCSEVAGRPDEAIEYSQRSLSLKDPTGKGTESILLPTLLNLGELYLSKKNYDLAKLELDRALKIAEPLHGIDERSIKAQIYSACGDLARGEGNLDQSYLWYNKAFGISLLTGAKSVEFAHSLNSIALINALQNDFKSARVNVLKGSYLLKTYAATYVGQLSFAEQCAYADTLQEQTNLLLSICTDSQSLSKAYSYIAQWKGFLVESLRRRTSLQKLAGNTPDIQKLLDQLNSYHRQLDILSDQSANSVEARKKRDDDIANLSQECEALERDISLKSNGITIADPMATKGCLELQKMLAPDEAIVDVIAFTNSLTGKNEYDCIILTQGAGPILVNLRDADAINNTIAAWRASANVSSLPKRDLSLDRENKIKDGIYDSKLKEEKVAQQELRKLIWNPIESSLPNSVEKIWLCPDSDAAILPWSMFTVGSKFQLCTIDSPREFVSLRETKKSNDSETKLLVAADIKFGDKSLDLPGTKAELDSIKNIAAEDKVVIEPLTGSEATEQALASSLPTCSYAHFATHGFYSGASTDESRGSQAKAVRALRRKRQARGELSYLIEMRNPLMTSGLLLSGGKARNSAAEGKMTAADLVGLDLHNCNLVTLSACETGLGKKMNGQGVIGLRSAIWGAGARAILMSLWKVDDAATCRLMKEFYTNLFTNHNSPVESLRLAQEAVRKEPNWEHPFYWAGWVLAGDGWQ